MSTVNMRRGGDQVNETIRAEEVKVIGSDGTVIGVMRKQAAIEIAESQGLDLVLVSAETKPPVCKIVDYGKMKYLNQKKANKARKNQKLTETKEVKIRWVIQDHDFIIKLQKMRDFLNAGDYVKVMMRFRGREVLFSEAGYKIFDRISEDLADIAKVQSESDRKDESLKQIYMLLVPAHNK